MRKIKLKAFTLLECLVTLIVLSGGILLFQGMGRLLQEEIRAQNKGQEEDWLLFTSQLRAELEVCRLDKVEGKRLYVWKDKQKLCFSTSKAGEFKKTDDHNQGYQPMLSGIEGMTIRREGPAVELVFQLKDLGEKRFVYAFETRS